MAAVDGAATATAEGATAVAALLPANPSKAGRADTHRLHILLRDLVHEAAAGIGRHRAIGAPRCGIGQIEALLRTGDCDIGEAALLLESCGIFLVPSMREDAFLHARDEDDRELQALCRVYCHERDGAGGAAQGIEVAPQSQPFHEGRELLGGRRRQDVG